ncbi:MAG TPA: hypothetical protein VEW47_11415 [Candidatus Dormibacteraeota bacterium]|nr:hypothetical protein [Candidatus Dormibacteraeota bacterium]
MRAASRILAQAVVLLALRAPPEWPSQTAAPPTDLQFIVGEAQKVQKADVTAWSHYRFGRRSEREDFDDTGRVVDRDDLEFVVTPDGDGFREELVLHNGVAAEPSERDLHRRSASFNKHYRTLLAGDEGKTESGYSLGQLLHLSSYRFMGEEVRNGVDCYRLDFSPDDVQPRTSGLAAKFTKAMQGSLWITVEGFHLAAARAETVRPISIALSLSKIYDLEVRMEAGPVGEGVWLPLRVEVRTHARILIKSIRRHNLFTYSDFLRLDPAG